MTILLCILGATIAVLAGCMVLAHFTDYEAAASTGCVEEGQAW